MQNLRADLGRMRQIITPLPKAAKNLAQKKAVSASNSRRASSADSSDDSLYVPCFKADPASSHLSRRRASSALSDYGRSRARPTPPQLGNTGASLNPFSFSSDFPGFPGFNPSLTTTLLPPQADGGYGLSLLDNVGPSVSPPTPLPNHEESRLVDFFLREIPKLLPFATLFPAMGSEIWAMSLTHVALTQAIFALAACISDRRSGISSVNGYTYLEKALRQVQESIATGGVDEGLIAAVFLLAFQSTLAGDYKGARRHLQGMLQIFQAYQARGPRQGTQNPEHFPIIMLIYRMAIHMEYHVSFYNSGQGPPVFPVLSTSLEATHTRWISQIIDKSIPNGVEWALASFALDDLMNRAGHFYHQASESNPTTNNYRLQQLMEEHQNWKRRAVVNRAILETNTSSLDCSVPPNLMQLPTSFLNYPRVHVANELFAGLFTSHLMIGIYLSLLSDPRPGPVSPERVQYAIDVCRYFAALYVDTGYSLESSRASDNCMALVTSGLVFRPDTHPNEFDFCIRMLSDIASETGFVALFDVVQILKDTWKNRETNWSRLFEMKVLSSPTVFRWDGSEWSGGYAEEIDNLNFFGS